MKKFMPISIDINNKKILIVGGGKVATHKVKLLKRFTNNITVIGSEIANDIKKEDIRYFEKNFDPSDLDGYFLVYTCTNSRDLNRKVKEHANKLGLLVNVADDPEICDFVSPAIYIDDNMAVAVSSNGENVMKSIRWRDKIKDYFLNGKA